MKKILIIMIVLAMFTLLIADTKVDELVEKSYEYETAGNYQQALTNMFAVTHLAPSDAYYNLRTGWLYYSLYNYFDALKYYVISYNLDKNFEALEGIVLCNYMLGNWEETISYGELVLQKNPKDFLTLSKLGYSYFVEQNWTKAAEYYGRACDIYSYNITCLSYYLSALVENKQTREAKIVYQKLKKLNPNNLVVAKYANKLN